MTIYIPAYDTEQDASLVGVKENVRVHEAFEILATFFVVAKLLEGRGGDYPDMVGNHPLFEIASHYYTHMLLHEHPRSVSPARPTDQHRREIVESKNRIEDHFGCEVKGFRPAPTDAYIEATIETPAQEFRMSRIFLDDARAKGIGNVTRIWRSRSPHKFDPCMAMLDQTFQYVLEQDLETAPFEGQCESARSEFGGPCG